MIAAWVVNSYTATWSGGTGYTIFVNRTGSPYKGASVGVISSGDVIYYGDTLSITYTKADYYTIQTNGKTSITVTGDVTSSDIFATATLNPLSDWKLELPSGAKKEAEKWTYVETTYKESSETSLSGYTKYDSYWQKSGAGSVSYATFPAGYNTDDWYYLNYGRGPVDAYETGTRLRQVENKWSGWIYWHWMYNVAYSSGTSRTISSRKGTYGTNNWWYGYWSAFAASNDGAYLSNTYQYGGQALPTYNCAGFVPDTSLLGTGTARYFRFDYYTSYYTDYYKVFKYYRNDNRESDRSITPSSTISNVQHWIKYREK